MKKLLLLFLSSLTVLSCTKTKVSNQIVELEDTLCNTPSATILIQPYNDFTKEEVNKFISDLQENMGTFLYGEWNIKVLEPKQIPFQPVIHNKYAAIDFLKYQKINNKRNEIVIGVTHEDICKDLHGKKNYGIVGLSFCPGNSVIVSDKRLKNKGQIWKPIIHEFIHAFYGAKHCPNDDPTCFMVDAKGHGNFSIQNKLCDSCKN